MRILSTVRLTQHQRLVIANIAAAATPVVAAHAISNSANMVAARDLLMKMGAITVSDDGAALTDSGSQVAQDENLIDQSGQLTDVGQSLLGDGQQSPAGGADPSMPPPGGDDQFSLESVNYSLLKQLLK